MGLRVARLNTGAAWSSQHRSQARAAATAPCSSSCCRPWASSEGGLSGPRRAHVLACMWQLAHAAARLPRPAFLHAHPPACALPLPQWIHAQWRVRLSPQRPTHLRVGESAGAPGAGAPAAAGNAARTHPCVYATVATEARTAATGAVRACRHVPGKAVNMAHVCKRCKSACLQLACLQSACLHALQGKRQPTLLHGHDDAITTFAISVRAMRSWHVRLPLWRTLRHRATGHPPVCALCM